MDEFGLKQSDSIAARTDGVAARAFAVLEALALSEDPIRLSRIARRLELQKSTVHRILATLIHLGYAEQVPETGCYRANLRLWELGSTTVSHHPVKRAASGYLQQLHQATRETVSLTVLSGIDVLYLDKIVSPRPVRFTSRVGSRVPAPLTAGGKAILAYEPNAPEIIHAVRERIAEGNPLCIASVLHELEDVRRHGYAISSGRPGVRSFAAPIMGQDGRAAAALSVSAPESRLSKSKQESIVEQLLGTCADIADRVGNL